MLGQITDVIILVAAVLGALVTIYKFFASSGKFVTKKAKEAKVNAEKAEKERVQTIVKEMMPEILYQHDLDTRERYKSDRQRYLNEIKDEVTHSFENDITVVYELKSEVAKLSISAKDVLREKIMKIYFDNRADRKFTEHEREALDQYYKDYKALNGNSYIDRYYNRMNLWEIIADDYEDQ